MSAMEWNKIFGAILLAGLIAMLTSFVANRLVAPEPLEQAHYLVGAPAGGTHEAAPEQAKGPEPIAALLASADPAKGEKVAKACAACHDFSKGGAHKVGPNLYGVVAAPKAHAAGFNYSASVKGLGGNWDYDSLNAFLFNPKAYAPGTKMTFAGVKSTQDRANLVAWLRTVSDTPAPLP